MIKRLEKRDLLKKLYSIGVDQNGLKGFDKKKLAKRLKGHYKKIFCGESKVKEVHVECKYFVCIDFEATCERINFVNHPHEIIEFPAILVDIEKEEIISEFHSYVRPFLNEELSDFCIELTGIKQNQVNAAPYFPIVFKSFIGWLKSHGLLKTAPDGRVKITKDTPSWTFLTDSPADICKFLSKQCQMDDIPFPYTWASRYCNIKRIFMNVYKSKYGPFTPKIEDMLEVLGMEVKGNLHSGRDDARNISRIALKMIQDGAQIWQNEMYKPNKYNSNAPYYLPKPDCIIPRILYSDEPWTIDRQSEEEKIAEKMSKMKIKEELVSSASSEEEEIPELPKKKKPRKGRHYIPNRPPDRLPRPAREGLTPEEQRYADAFIEQTERMQREKEAINSSEQVFVNSPVPLHYPEVPIFCAPMPPMPLCGETSSPIFVPQPSPFFNAVGPFFPEQYELFTPETAASAYLPPPSPQMYSASYFERNYADRPHRKFP
ncbi:Oidioi.mRNA.OKI2018_I69.XSR.g15673.t1.cds [Oikopleura dioica]|uniref:Oidioi.mRNA.OKI2018_I69.XSR.g15673.t1.cds n=1 Tax=Oikopleura dioica TaxID=34765 RepID=A0ABN7SE43_OIKDI|nr:Oidioi.mRNA.OKI2018_I69.XSR.g15673.t1.cds [Oikopleura dioica]